jgi:hypothetical protein
MSKETLPATPITIESAINKVLAAMPEEGKLIQAMARKDIVALGTGEAFALTDPTGKIRAYRSKVTFSTKDGTIADIKVAKILTAQGYDIWAQTVGASHYFPDTVTVEGKPQPNPYPYRDPDNKRLLGVYCRVRAGCLGPTGVPQMVDWIYYYDVPVWRMVDLLGKAKAFPQAFKLRSRDSGKPNEEGEWIGYPYDEAAMVWVNGAHQEALKMYAEMVNRERHIISVAQTNAVRNALKHLSGIQKPPILRYEKNGNFTNPVYADTFSVPVTIWKYDVGMRVRWDETAETHQKLIGLRNETASVASSGIVSSADDEMAEHFSPEDEIDAEVVDADFTHEPPLADAEQEPDIKQEPPPTEETKAKANFEEIARQFPDEFKRACKELKLVEYFTSIQQASLIADRVKAILLEG